MLAKVMVKASDAILILKEGLLYNNIIDSSIILLYHRVLNYDSDPQLLAVSPDNFREQMQYLKKNYQIISLEKLTKDIIENKVPKNSVAITFDDGYADNYHFMKPVLEELDIPATIFVTTSLIDSEREFWWDEIEQVFLHSDDLPDRLDLKLNGYQVSMNIENSVSEKFNDWNITVNKNISSRKKAYVKFHSILKTLDHARRDELMDFLFNWAGKERRCRKFYRTMTSEEILDTSKGGLIEIGAHTDSHSALSILTKENQKDEILRSKIKLEEIINLQVKTFAYPFGSHFDYNKSSVLAVKESGFSSSYSNFPLKISRRSDVFQQTRFLIRDWNCEEFAIKMKKYSHGLWN
jgi:peptidoglycan/xylan/chitin deacetylase (PgdA/CDA1 family)